MQIRELTSLLNEGRAVLRMRNPTKQTKRWQSWKEQVERANTPNGPRLSLRFDQLAHDIGFLEAYLSASESIASKVFVVHGRNAKLRDSLYSFLESVKIDPIDWEQALKLTGKPNPHIWEVLKVAFGAAQAILVLFSPDDRTMLRRELWTATDERWEKKYMHQARPNVLFEAGMALGQNEDRTILVQVGDIRPFSDIYGRYVTRLNNTAERRTEFVNRLRAAGCRVDTTSTRYLAAGDFENYI